MRRVRLIEIAEQPWCPRVVRDGLTDYLQFAIDRGRPYATAAPLLAAVARASRGERPGLEDAAARSAEVTDVVDLGSGAGGPWPALAPALAALGTPVRVRLTESRLFWTYVVPVIPLVVLFDGIVSCLRTYTPDELRALAAGLTGPAAEQYAWDAGEAGGGPIPMTYLVGYVAERTRSGEQAASLAQPTAPPSSLPT